MNRRGIIIILCFFFTFLLDEVSGRNISPVNVMDYITDQNGDVIKEIQRAIDENPNRVIYFPDGVYNISSPILTPANPYKSVCLELSNYAVIRPVDGWKNESALICLGRKDPYNTILIPGSNYYLSGGIIDCRNLAKGISVDCGRETLIKDVAIKSAQVGIHVKKGLNGGSSDCDILDVNITGNMEENSVGIVLEGHDNTVTNVRIYRMQTGVHISSGSNILRNVHPLYGSADESLYATGTAFVDKYGNNWYDFCYSDQYATGFRIESGVSIYNDCFSYWYSNRGDKHVCFQSVGPFDSIVTNFKMGLTQNNAVRQNIVLEEKEGSAKGAGCFRNLVITDPRRLTSKNYEKYTIR